MFTIHPLLKGILLSLGIAGGPLVLFGILFPDLLTEKVFPTPFTTFVIPVCFFIFPPLLFLAVDAYLYDHITGHRPRFTRYDPNTGYHLNWHTVFRLLEDFGYMAIGLGLFPVLFYFFGLPGPSVSNSIIFSVCATLYVVIRLNYVLKPAYAERAATAHQKEVEERRKEAEELKKAQETRDALEPLLLAQEIIRQKYVIIGTPTNRDPKPIFYQHDERSRHTYVIGSTGSGKTTFLCNLIAQDIHYGNGLIVLASEKDLFEKLLPLISEDRRDELIYFDPHDITPPIIGFNPFTRGASEDVDQKAGETMTILKRAMGGDLGVSMEPIIDNAVAALIQRPQATFADLIRLIDPSDSTLRAAIKNDPTIDEETRVFWQRYDQSTYYRKSHEAVRNRFTPFSRRPISTIFATPSFSFKTVLNTDRHIIFLDLSQLRDMALVTMGQLLLASIQQSLLSRDAIPEDARIPYYLYIDEFQIYAKDSEKSLIDIFNGARKFKLGVTLAHQTIHNIPRELLGTITGNAQTTVALRLAADDASFFARQLQIKEPTALQNLDVGYGYVQTPTHKIGVHIAIPATPVVPLPRPTPSDELKARSKQNFGLMPASRGTNPPPPPDPQPASPPPPPTGGNGAPPRQGRRPVTRTRKPIIPDGDIDVT